MLGVEAASCRLGEMKCAKKACGHWLKIFPMRYSSAAADLVRGGFFSRSCGRLLRSSHFGLVTYLLALHRLGLHQAEGSGQVCWQRHGCGAVRIGGDEGNVVKSVLLAQMGVFSSSSNLGSSSYTGFSCTGKEFSHDKNSNPRSEEPNPVQENL